MLPGSKRIVREVPQKSLPCLLKVEIKSRETHHHLHTPRKVKFLKKWCLPSPVGKKNLSGISFTIFSQLLFQMVFHTIRALNAYNPRIIHNSGLSAAFNYSANDPRFASVELL
mmetsp:Transcript_759/g.2539  ORF Transcript_759/g.2539 Transcript_759/m.2539 type:complete len:113 (-) Transcript_759:1088-1426(-)